MDAPDFIPDDQVPTEQAQPQASAPDFVPDEQFKPDEAPDFVPDSHVPDNSKYETPGQQALTLGENFAKGIAPGLATYAENKLSQAGVPGLSPEEQVARKTANPIEAAGSEIAGNVGLMTALPEVEFLKLGQVGTKAINGMLQMGLISGGDEISKSLLGQGDPIDAVASHMAESAGIGLLTGGLFGKAEQLGAKGLKALENEKYGAKITGFLSGFGHAATFPESEVLPLNKSAFMRSETSKLDPMAFKTGQKAYNAITGDLAGKAAKYGSDYAGYKVGGLPGVVMGHVIGEHLEKLINTNLPKASQKYVGPAILKAASSSSIDNLSQIIDHATTIGKGAQKISKGVEALFNAGSNQALDYDTSEKQREKLRHYIENDDLGQEIKDENNQTPSPSGFAEGGKVENTVQKPNAVATVYPEQNVLLSAAKGRVSGYLNSIRPVKNMMKLPFDSDHKDPQKEREYNKALDFANQPMSILKKIKNGTLVPKDMEHLTNMYPELHSHLSKKITEKIADHKMDETKKPPYHVRQAMSLFMGSNLDSTMTQPSMQAAQNVFAQQNAQKQAPPNSKSSLSKLGEAAQTPEQARTQRLNKN